MSAAAGAGDSQYRKMTQTPIPRLVATLAVPTIISMLVTAVYNMADTFFWRSWAPARRAPWASCFADGRHPGHRLHVGHGRGQSCFRYLGAKEQRQADCAAPPHFFTALTFGLGITVLGTLFLDPLMRVLGATPTILPYARDYARYILFGAPVMCASFVLNNILRGEGKAMLAMVGIGLGGVLNIGLDPLFIYTFRLGIAGAAIATLLSQCVSFAILLACFLRRKSAVRLHIGQVSRKAEVYARIIKTGMPSFCRQSLASVATVLLNVNAAVYGDAAVAAMSVVDAFMFVFSFMLGFGRLQPVAGYNFGAKRYDRVRGATYFTMLVGTVLMSVLAAAGFLAAPGALALFRRDDAEVIAIGALALRAQCVVLPLFGVSTVTNMLLQVTGQSGQATFLSLCRQGIFFVPFILLLPQLIGLLGVQLAQPAADLCTFAVTLPFLLSFLRRLKLWEQAERAVAEK
ncbi:MAG: MATE family efflux transporter [Ruthenibacterium lactatiformans]